MLKNIFTILYKDYRIELSQSHLFFSVVLYLLSSIYIIYLAFQPLGVSNIETWVSVFWVIILFGAITVVSKSFFQESYKRKYKKNIRSFKVNVRRRLNSNNCFHISIQGRETTC